MPTKPNPFLKKAAKSAKPNPFLEKAKKQKPAKPVDQLAVAREAKARKKIEAEEARIAAIPQEIKMLEDRIEEVGVRYERAQAEATKLFTRLDKLKDKDSPRFRELRVQWTEAEDMTLRLMANLQGAMNALKSKRQQAA